MSLVNLKDLIIPFASAEMNFGIKRTEPALGLTISGNFRTLSLEGDFLPDKRAIFWTIRQAEISPELIKKFIDMRNLIANLADNAENMNAQFLSLNKFVLGKTDEELNEPGAREFMKLKNNVVSYVKRDLETKHLLSSELRKSLEQFILYRNIFIHGRLSLLVVAPEDFVNTPHIYSEGSSERPLLTMPGRFSNDEWYITFLNTAGQTIPMKITKEMLENYEKVYSETMTFINIFRKIKPYLDTTSTAIQDHLHRENIMPQVH